MKRFFLFFAAAVFAGNAFAQTQNSNYQFSVDLTKVKNDMLTVELVTPVISVDTILYRMPAMVPGTYKIYDFGKFASNFKAFDKNGAPLTITNQDINSWKIAGAKQLYRLTYEVEDTWDSNKKGEFVFEPAGTNFQADTNFVLNNHGIFGYFQGMHRNTYVVNITHPDGFFGATGLSDVTRSGNTDTYTIKDYNSLVDGPIMYNRPDTAHVLVGGADVLISVYSPRKLVTAKFIADSLRILLDQQRQYLGGTLPVKNYAFIIYLTDNPKGFKSGSFGALEHSYSSMYAMLEMKPEFIAQTVKDVSAHEFFHIVTPLNIHSEEIGDFDFNKPEMSQHLWLYEGLTEYAAHHVQIKYGTQSLETFLETMSGKMIEADNYDDELSFTKMSLEALDKHEDQYGNVYQKGALIGLCLDIRLRELSDGKYGTQELMRDLALKYGKDKSFNDDSLFSDIVKLTYPEIGDFFKKHVIGGEPLPFREVFEAVGVEYKRRGTVTQLDPLGGYGLRLDQDGNLRLWPNQPNDFAKEMGYQKGDVLVAFNGKNVDATNVGDVIGNFLATAKDGQKMVVKIKRYENGKFKTKKLKGKLHPVSVTKRHMLTPVENPTPEQLKLRKSWINK